MTMSQYEAKRPMTVLAGSYGHPLHPLLVTVPIGAWTASLVFDAASHVVRVPGFLAQGSEWLIAVGVAGAIAAAFTGLLDYYALPPGTRAYRAAVSHMMINLAVTVGYGAGFVWRYASYHRPGAVPAAQIALSAASLAMLAFSGYLGGKLAFRYGVRVADERTQAEGFAVRTAAPAPAAARHASPGWQRNPPAA